MPDPDAATGRDPAGDEGIVSLPTGPIALETLIRILNALPVDLTFADDEDRITYFSEGPECIFSRPRSVIGTKVQDCHSPQSQEAVEHVLQSLKDGARDTYEFWLQKEDKFIHGHYLAVRDDKGLYLGTLEVVQDVTRARSLKGEKKSFE